MSGRDRPPRELFDAEQQPEDDDQKERRERRRWGRVWSDCDPRKLQLRPRNPGPPQIRPFMLESVGPDFTIGFFGKRREGKSYAMRWVLEYLKDQFPRGYVFTNTKMNHFWQQYVPANKIFKGYSPGVMDKIRQNQEEIVEWMHEHPEEADRVNPNVFIVMDDCISQDLHHAEQLKDIFFNGRHLKMLLLISLQFAKGIPPGFRENCDMAFCFRMHSLAQVEAISENFLGHLDKKTARNVLESVVWKDEETDERQFLVVDCSGNSPIDEMLYAGQAIDPGEFKLGCKEFWEGKEPEKPPGKKKSAPPPKPKPQPPQKHYRYY